MSFKNGSSSDMVSILESGWGSFVWYLLVVNLEVSVGSVLVDPNIKTPGFGIGGSGVLLLGSIQ